MKDDDKVNGWLLEAKRLLREWPEQPKVVYLASCYRSARGEHGVDQNIAEAKVWARKIWKLGIVCISPVMNTAYFGGIDVPDDIWLTGDYAILRRCDAVVMHPNWEASVGAQEERTLALSLAMPVFHLPQQWRKLAAWGKK